MPNLVERRLTTVVPEEAKRLLQIHNAYRGQRRLRPGHVALLAEKMKNGMFLQGEISYALMPDGRSVLTNGQHTLNAGMVSGVPFNASIYGYECKDENDLYTVYSETDQGLRRNYGDVVRAGRSIMPDHVCEMPPDLVSLFGAAILMASENGRELVFNSRSITPQSRVFAVCARPLEARFLYSFRNVGSMNRISARMAMVATYRADPIRAEMFWNGVADTEHLPASDPRRILATRVLDMQIGIDSAYGVKKVYGQCIAHWNAYVTGQPLQSVNAEDVPPAMTPTIPAPVLATVTNLPKTSPAPQTFTAHPSALSATAPMSANA